ncbi:MAG: hypothetical protein HGA24_09660, partial [Candidatus Aminicenantes bacterium]|nr:hypothetical protein [Candidatus Aminicenantes bacterium]
MRLSKRSVIALAVVVVLAGLLAASPQGKAPAKGQKKVENTDPGQRLKWFEQHTA